MIERVTKENLDQYEAFIKKHPKGLFQHSSKWAKVKSAWTVSYRHLTLPTILRV